MARRSAAAALLCLSVFSCSGRRRPPDERAPEVFRVRFETTKGPFVLEVTRAWTPLGADRIYTLVRNRFYNGVRFFRVVPRFVVQFGINGDTATESLWREAKIMDDPVKHGNVRGAMAFATDGPNTRTTQVFINLADNSRLDARGFAPFGQVISGMEVVDRFYNGYGDGPPMGPGPSQPRMEAEGNAYLEREFPKLDSIVLAKLE